MSTNSFNNREMLLFGAVVVLLSVAISVGIQSARFHHHMGQRFERFGGPGMMGERGVGMHGSPDGFMARADANKDGFLTKDELMAGAKDRIDKMFAEADTDKDGKLSKDELEKGREAMREKMRQRFEQQGHEQQ